MYFIEEFAKLRICLFRCVFCRNLAKRVICIRDGLHEPYLLLTNNLFILILSDWHRGCLIWSKHLKASLMSFTCSLFSDKVCCFNQSEPVLYGNFIIISIDTLNQPLIKLCSIEMLVDTWLTSGPNIGQESTNFLRHAIEFRSIHMS